MDIKTILQYFMLCLLLFASFMSYESYAALKSLTEFNRNTLVEERLMGDLKDAECGQRGYLYTGGNEDYLPQYYVGVTQAHTDLDALRYYLHDKPNSQPVFDQLSKDVAQKLHELKTTISLFRSGKPDQTRSLVDSGAGLTDMERIRNELDILKTQERDRLHYRGLLP